VGGCSRRDGAATPTDSHRPVRFEDSLYYVNGGERGKALTEFLPKPGANRRNLEPRKKMGQSLVSFVGPWSAAAWAGTSCRQRWH